ncbi:toprim domain-containing protein [Chryseobacterium sp.]|uniref:toprim domain-containing protein n=1 Tax=Chryseobacterium sp. TaxID=1871047 RepID=UPI0025BBE380|nr:toprim domain-containing protein [Chryseobacterium sp.]
MAKYTQQQIDHITSSVSLLDYFLHLENQGKVKFDVKKGRDYFFKTEYDKFSVNDKGFFSFHSNQGGQILKAVMTLENKSWKDSLDFLAEFSNNYKYESIAERKNEFKRKENTSYSEIKIQYSGIPNNERLLAYFAERGISKQILQQHTKQVHYENNGKKYFGIGIENHSGGFEIRNPLAKIKIGKTDISEIKGNKNEMIVFEGMTDMLSFLQLQKLNENKNSRTLISLNSITNVDRFLSIYNSFEGKIFLCLDGDKAGNLATQKILQEFSAKNIKDIRPFYSISENKNNDLNDYLKVKLNIQSKYSIFNKQTASENGHNTTQSEAVPTTQQVEPITPEPNIGESFKESQSGQGTHNNSGQKMGSDDVGDGFTGPKRSSSTNRESRGRSLDGTQPENVGKSKGEKYSLGERLLKNSTNSQELDSLILQYKEQKLTNEQVAEVVSAACFISDNQKVLLRDNLRITEDLKNIANQYKSGGTSKEGRGILDEYYTEVKIVDAVHHLLKDNLKDAKTLNVLEPSVGTGNFLYAVKQLDAKSFVTAFEINETTAKIAKIFHPEAEINLRSFETEFIDENGIKSNAKDYQNQYHLVIGNPPYGEYRGFYKGLGEEPRISKYEDYFVKRSLDVLKEGGTLAMVLPSGWLNRQKKLENAEISKAYRLPVGAFKGTQIGTDIVILKKSQQDISYDISDYFEKNPQNILGEIREKTNRFGRLEQYVYGNLDEALAQLEKLQTKKETERLGNLFEDLVVEDQSQITSPREETVKETNIEGKGSLSLSQTKEKIELALSKLEDIKFKSPAVQKEIEKYTKLHTQLINKSSDFTQNYIQKIHQKADKIIQSQSEKNLEYKIQIKPEIKKGILKYQFSKQDEIVNTSLQNASEISEEQVKAFKDTQYDGTLNNKAKHSKFANFIDGKWVHDFYYTEGNIYAKLKQLEIDFADKNSVGGTEDQYEKQKALLEKVLPKTKSLDEIIISPNHEFVHQFSLGMIQKLQWNPNTRASEPAMVEYNLAEKFKDFVSTLPYDAFAGSSSWEVRSFVDNETVTGSDKERNALIRERRKTTANDLFSKFIHEELPEDLRDRFVKEFNENYNNIHVPDYSKFPLFSKIYRNFKGEELKLTEVQKAGIGRQTTKGIGLLAHEVGFGKTLSGVLAMHEAMQRGNAKRPLIVVPNDSILKQWMETIFETIPNAKVNVLGNLGKDYDLSKFDNKDGEISLVTYEGFNNIGFSREVTEKLASKFNYISASELKSITNTERDVQIELQKEKEISGKMKCGKIYDWEDFKFDHLTFDEVHNANHIVGKVRIEDRRFASDFRNQNQQTSKLGINTWMAAQYIQDKHNGRNITLLSATPFTNKPLEYYSILSLIANKRLEEAGYFKVNTFFDTFMEADNDMEIDAKGDVKFKANVRRFKNNTLFQQLLSEFIDIKGEEDNPELVRPNKINKEYKVEQNSLTKQQYELLNDSFSETEKGAILTHILNARLIAISPYLSPFYDDEEPTLKEFIENSPKLNETMKLIRLNKKDIPESGQIIYSELAVAEFPKLKEYLIKEVGYKSEEIGIITGATSKTQRVSIQDNFNSGKIKIIIGSEAIQEGMNLQIKTTDTYLLSLPYNFTSLRQVEGRSWRQGNENENVRINFMLTNDSIDVFMLQKLQAKQARYLEAMKKGADVLDISDINTQELKTSIITNPETRANIEVELLKKRLEGEKNKFLADFAFVHRKYEDFTKAQAEVTKAEESYNRVLGYSKEENEHSEWWTKQISSNKNTVDLAKQEQEKIIQNLAEKGVNVTEIEKQTQSTQEKISELNDKLENLPELRAELIALYHLEKEEMLRKNVGNDYVKQREEENKKLFMSPMAAIVVEKTNTLIEERKELLGRKR